MVIDHAHDWNERTNDHRSDEVELVHPEILADGLTYPASHPAWLLGEFLGSSNVVAD